MTNYLDTFMCLMNSVLCPYLDKFFSVFIDDILVYSQNEEDHVDHLVVVLRLLREHQLYSSSVSVVYFRVRYITWDMLSPRRAL